MQALTHEYITAEYLKRRIRLLSVYHGYVNKNQLGCLDCGYKWEAYYGAYGCPNCAIQNRNTKNRKSKDDVIAWYDKKQIDVLSEYVNNRLPLDLVCRICGHKWSTSFGRGCPVCCKINLRLDTNEVKKRLNAINIIFLSPEFINFIVLMHKQ